MPLGELPKTWRTCDNCECTAWPFIAECHEQRENGGVCPTWTESTESLRARAEQRIADLEAERDEALAKLAPMEWMCGHATRLRNALQATTEECLSDDLVEAQPAKLLARAEKAERERDHWRDYYHGSMKRTQQAEARVKELEETVRLRDEKLALEAETIALNHDASKRGWRELAALKAEIAELKRERDELKAKLAEAENLLRTDSHGDIRSVFEMEGRAEKAEAERDGLKGQLARAETRERDLEVVNSRVEADYAALLEKGRALFQYGHLLETVVGDVGEFAAALAANPAGAALLEIVKAAEGLEAWSSGAPDAFHRLNEHIDAICEAVRRKRGE